MLMHVLEFFEGDLCTEPAWKVKFAHLVPLHMVSTYSIHFAVKEVFVRQFDG